MFKNSFYSRTNHIRYYSVCHLQNQSLPASFYAAVKGKYCARLPSNAIDKKPIASQQTDSPFDARMVLLPTYKNSPRVTMTDMYPFRSVEEKWQKIWEQEETDSTPEILPGESAKKCYVLEMLPYPSGKIHMGHVRNYSIGDVLARFKRALGYKVLHPMGWDAFGMPAENAAMQNHTSPKTWTLDNIKAMKKSLKPLGFSYDWSREVSTCSEEYYGKEQELFLEMYQRDLIYRKESWVNWDPVDNTVLANEQVIDGKGWRSGATVVKKLLPHWCIRITQYADELLKDLNTLSSAEPNTGWPEKVLTMQRNWIGRSEGIAVQFPICDKATSLVSGYIEDFILAFTTRPETLFGASFCAVAPTHPFAEKLAERDQHLAAFIEQCQSMPTTESALSTAEKQGYDTGIRVRNPFHVEETIPVYVTNFVVSEYGTGAIFGCPAHDARDFDFAQKYNLPIRSVIAHDNAEVSNALPYEELEGRMVNSQFLNDLPVLEARQKAIERLENLGIARKQTSFRLRDWTVSRQRYWGCPIPIIHCAACGVVPVPKKDLPVLLPDDVEFNKPGNPLNFHPTWKHTTCPKCGCAATRETDTLDTFFDSSWYFLRYCCAHAAEPLDKKVIADWLPVDFYIGGIEHAVLHLLYARFFTKVLSDIGHLSLREPFSTLLTQGMVCHTSFKNTEGEWLFPEDVEKQEDGSYLEIATGREVTALRSEKMSKSKKNVVDPDKIVSAYGADALRIFIMSDTPYEKDFDWNTEALEGSWRYVNKMWRLCQAIQQKVMMSEDLILQAGEREVPFASASPLLKTAHSYLQKIQQAFESFYFHKALALHRELTREIETHWDTIEDLADLAEIMQIWTKTIYPFAPHFALEAYATLFQPSNTITLLSWPKLRSDLTQCESVTIAVQVNGKLRGTFDTAIDTDEETIREQGLALEKVQRAIDNKPIRKVIFVPNKLLNIVV